MKRKLTTMILTAAMAVTMILPMNVNAAEEAKEVKVGISWHEMQSLNITVWSEWLHTYGEEIGAEQGVKINWIELTGDGTTVQEASNIEDLINQQVDYMVIWCNDVNVIGPSIEEAQGAGIKVITIDHQDAGKIADVHVGQDTVDQAIVASRAMAEILKEDGKEGASAIEIFGDLGDSNSVNRSNGWKQVEEEEGAWTTVVTEPTEWKTENFKTGVVNAFTAHPEADVMFLASDFAFSAVQSALEEVGRWAPRGEEGHVYICTQDINVQAYQAFVDGYIDCGVAFDNLGHAKKVVEVICDMANGKEVEKEYWVQSPLVTAENIETEPSVWGRDYLNNEE